MALFTDYDVRTAGQFRATSKSASRQLNEAARTTRQSFDVFLSHSVRDAELILGTLAILEKFGLAVYVDWIVDYELDREKVTPATAEVLRARMRQCKSLVYVHTHNSPTSRWMPWELGFSDGLHGRVAILPIVRSPSDTFVGQEYLGIYPYVDQSIVQGTARNGLWVNTTANNYKEFGTWLR